MSRYVKPWSVIALLWILPWISFSCAPQPEPEIIRVACVGDSVTYGNGIEDREKHSYPAQLGRLLGAGWEVRNFGVNGATLLKKGNMPYWQQQAFHEATAFKPHRVILLLGTNDIQPNNWKHKKEFAPDYKAMIAWFAGLESRPEILVCLPAPAFPDKGEYQDRVIREQMIPTIRDLTRAMDVTVVDLYDPLSGKPHLFLDSFHPNLDGARVIAETIYSQLLD